MTDEMWADLRTGIEFVVQVARAEGGVSHHLEMTTASPDGGIRELRFNFKLWETAFTAFGKSFTPPPLNPACILALNVLVGDPTTLPQALADYLLDQGHEYATAVFEKGKAQGREEERKRCLTVVDKEESLCQYDTPPFTALAEVRDMIATGFAPPATQSFTPPDPPPEPR